MPAPVEDLFRRFAASGDPGPLGEVFDRCSGELLSLALHLCGNPGDAEDALQATFVTAIEKRGEWDGARRLLPWLSGILVLHCRKMQERRARRREAELGELVGDDGTVIAANERRELVERLRVQVQALPDEQRSVLLLQLEHGLQPAQIAEVLAVAPGTVRMRLHRGLKALRGMLPAGLVALLGALLPSRGVAAVRQAVVRHAAKVVPVVLVGGGALLMKKVLVAVAAVLVVLLGWSVLAPPPAQRAVSVAETLEPQRGPVAAPPPVLAAAPDNDRVAASPPPPAAEAQARLTLRVVWDQDGAPLPNVPLQLVPVRSDVDPIFDPIDGITGADGVCALSVSGDGSFRVEAIGGLRKVVDLRRGTTVSAELRVPSVEQPVQQVRGHVVHADGAPAHGAQIVVSRSGGLEVMVAGVADAAGRFELPAVGGWVLVGARLSGFAPSPLQTCTTLRDMELILPGPGAALDGVVVDSAGAPVAGAHVWIAGGRGRDQWFDPRGFLSETRSAARIKSDADGRFHAIDLPAGELSLVVRADGHAPLRRYVETVAGEEVPVRCELADGCALRGVVVDGEGQPVVGAFVLLDGSLAELRTTGADGGFGFRAAAAKLQSLRIEGEDIEALHTERDLAAIPGEWRVVVQRLPRYLLRFVDEHGAPLVGWTVAVRASGYHPFATDADGRCRVPAPADDRGPLAVASPGNPRATLPCAWPAGILPGVECTIVVPAATQPSAVVTGTVLGVDGAPLAEGRLAVLRPDGSYISWHAVRGGAFRTDLLPIGDYVLEVHRQGRGAAGARYRVEGLKGGEVRNVGELRLPAEGMLVLHVVRGDGSAPRNARMFLYSGDHVEHFAPPADGQPHPWPEGHYEWVVMDDESLWQRGSVEVRVGAVASVEIALQPAVRRILLLPMPVPDWGEPKRVDIVLRAPDGSVYDRSDFDPRDELPFRYCPPLSVGQWTLELATDGGRRFVGTFAVESLEKSLEPIRVAVQPAR